MPRPSPRKLGKARDISDSPDRSVMATGKDSSPHDKSDQPKLVKKRTINTKILKEIQKYVKDETQ
jgi:hypothetical protein